MDLTALRAEFLARGYSYVDSAGTTRQDLWLNRGYQRICDAADWPFLQVTTTGTAPLAIADLGHVVYVVDTTNKADLTGRDASDIAFEDPIVTTAGTPLYWWLDDTTLKLYPTSSASLSVRYVKTPPDLTVATDVPVLPSRYHPLIVDAAVLEAARDASDLDDFQVLEADYEKRLGEMRKALLSRSRAPDYIRPVVSGWLARA